MRLAIPLAFLLASGAVAQVQPGDLLVTSWTQSTLWHYRTDGTLVRTYSGGGTSYRAVDVMPDGTLAVLRSEPAWGFTLFEPVTGAVIREVDLNALVGVPTDIAATPDGGLIVLDRGVHLFDNPRVLYYDRNGNLYGTTIVFPYNVSNHLAGDVEAGEDGRIYVSLNGAIDGAIQCLDASGSMLWETPTIVQLTSLDLDSDGILRTIEVDGWIQHYDTNGNSVGALGILSPARMILGQGGTFWGSTWLAQDVVHYNSAGAVLSTIQVPGGGISDLETASVARIGTNYCSAVVNSTGSRAEIVANGSRVVAANEFSLFAFGLPDDEFGYFLNSQTSGFLPGPGGSSGNLCLAGAIGRHVGAMGNSGSVGALQRPIDLSMLPVPSGAYSVVAGESWHFQCWYRDGSTSNFTDGVVVVYQ